MGDEKTTAQVHPYYLTNSLMDAAVAAGVKLTIASANGITFDESTGGVSAVSAVTTEGSDLTIPATDVVFAAGPWTGQLAKELLGSKAGAAADIVPRLISRIHAL